MAYRFYGYIQPSYDGFAFCTPIFTQEIEREKATDEQRSYFFYDKEVRDIVKSFNPVDLSNTRFNRLDLNYVSDIHDQPIYIFRTSEDRLIHGTKDTIAKDLREMLKDDRIDDFVKKDIAAFLGDFHEVESLVVKIVNEELDEVVVNSASAERKVTPSERIIQKASKQHKINFCSPRYMSSHLFEYGQQLPVYSSDFMNSIRDSVRKIGNIDVKRKIALVEEPIRDFNTLVAKIVSGDIFIPELCTASPLRSQSADFIEIGKLKYMGLVTGRTSGRTLINDYLSKMDATPLSVDEPLDIYNMHKHKHAIITKFPELLVNLSKRPGIRCIVQPAGVISEELERIKAQKGLEFKSLSISDESYIAETLTTENLLSASKIALLDWNIAHSLTKSSGDRLDLYLIEFKDVLRSGFFYPNSDIDYAHILGTAIREAFINVDQWNPQFESDANRALIELEAPKSVLSKLESRKFRWTRGEKERVPNNKNLRKVA